METFLPKKKKNEVRLKNMRVILKLQNTKSKSSIVITQFPNCQSIRKKKKVFFINFSKVINTLENTRDSLKLNLISTLLRHFNRIERKRKEVSFLYSFKVPVSSERFQ